MEGALHFENASLTLCFWSLEPEKLERRIKGNAEVDATGRYILSRWCAEAHLASCTPLREYHIPTAWVSILLCLFYRFSQDLNDGQAEAKHPAFLL